ncbi:hypothetical protein [Streptomyces sp. NPDC057690]|uniref:hypothetical protein n=1 Tax=Streptomyces sp. NPDC057690 TaxID=3346214 RepID=UPI0036A43493
MTPSLLGGAVGAAAVATVLGGAAAGRAAAAASRETAGDRGQVSDYLWTRVPPGSETTDPIEPADGAGARPGAETPSFWAWPVRPWG